MSARTRTRPQQGRRAGLAELRPKGGWYQPPQTIEIHPIEDQTSRRRTYLVRRTVDTREAATRFRTWIEADTYRARLEAARAAGERFNPATGEPTSWPPARATGRTQQPAPDRARIADLVAAYDPADDRQWLAQARCAGSGTDRFYPDRGESLGPARAVCGPCPVQEQCLIAALARGEKFGVWGGRSERERRQIRRALALDSRRRREAVA